MLVTPKFRLCLLLHLDVEKASATRETRETRDLEGAEKVQLLHASPQ